MSNEGSHPLDEDGVTVTVSLAIVTAATLLVVAVAYQFLDTWINVPFGFMEVWSTKGSVIDGLRAVWPIFAWGAGFTLLVGLIHIARRTPREYDPHEYLTRGTWLSLNAGLFEEVLYRWLRFFGAMMVIKILNAITFGFVKWLYVTIAIPLTNWASFGMLEAQLEGHYGWLFAAAIVSANIRFRDAHEYQGLFGMINAWYMGLVFFYLTFNYGLWVAIVAHVVYDLCVFWTRALTAHFQPRDVLSDLVRSFFTRRT